MGAALPTSVLVRLADAQGNSMEVTDVAIATTFLKNYTDAIGRPAVQTSAAPAWRIGQLVPDQGGIYGGLVRGDAENPDYHIFVGEEDKAKIKWQEAMDWAKSIAGPSANDYDLPLRKEQSVLFGNVPELFEKAWYWSCEQAADDPDSAWSQSFGYGGQTCDWKDNDIRARAVRRVPA